MKRITLMIKVLGILLMIVVICQSCTALMTLPKADTAEHFLTDHKEELQILAEYLVKQNYSTIYIDRADGTALADLCYPLVSWFASLTYLMITRRVKVL